MPAPAMTISAVRERGSAAVRLLIAAAPRVGTWRSRSILKTREEAHARGDAKNGAMGREGDSATVRCDSATVRCYSATVPHRRLAPSDWTFAPSHPRSLAARGDF